MRGLIGAFSCCWILAGCSAGNLSTSREADSPGAAVDIPPAALEVTQPEGWADDLALTIPEDIHPDPDVLEIHLDARVVEMEIVPGFMTPVWSYGGSLPGPLIRGKVGDRVIVHFKNSLPEATSIHWHGLRVPNEMDGAPGATQDPIAPGEEFTYDFLLEDAGTFWYHPHLNSAAQVGWGLYGPLVVDDPGDPEVFGDDLVLMFSDMSLNEKGEFYPVDSGGAFSDLFGREGRILLVNGKVLPTLKVRKGKQQRWRIINAARTRYYSLHYHGDSMLRLGGDNGLAERSQQVGRIMLVPGERSDLVFTPPDEPGTESILHWYPTERGYGSTFSRPSEKMMRIQTVDESPVVPKTIPSYLREIVPIDTAGAREVHVDLTIAYSDEGDVVMGINGVDGRSPSHDDHAKIEAKMGETQIWRVTNTTDFAHPFHLHGFYFQVLDDTRIPEWKDTIDVPVNSEIRIAVRFDDRVGAWMFHCHILDHAELGMMGMLRITR